LPNSYDTENLICGKCIKQKPSYDYARSILYFDEYSKKIIHALKYHDKTLIAKIMAKIMANKYPQEIAKC
jgi:predicted amidophosphoribosyltransferase